MTDPRLRVFLIVAVCLLGGTRLHAALPPGPAMDPAAEPATAPPLSSPLEPEPPKPIPAAMPVLAPSPAATPNRATPAVPAAAPAASQAPPARPDATPPAPVQKVAAGGILGRTVVGPDNQAIGRVVDVLVDAASNPRAVVIDFGGFMGVGSRRIAVNWSDLSFPAVSAAGRAGDIKLDLTAEQIMSAPEYTDQTKPAAVVEPPPAASALAKPGVAPGR